MIRLPKIVAAQRLQVLLLVTALIAVLLGSLLISDLLNNFETRVVADAGKSLSNAVRELSQAEHAWSTGQAAASASKLSVEATDESLRSVSYEVLRSYPDVEGGYFLNGRVVGQSFPTYTEPGSGLKQPPKERQEVLAALEESARTGNVARRLLSDDPDLVVVSAFATPGRPLATWALKRYIGFNDSRQLRRSLVLVSLMFVSLASIGGVLTLSFSLQRGFAAIQTGLAKLRTDSNHRIPDQNHELRNVVRSINDMAASRQKLEAELRREDRLRVMGRVVAGIAHEIRNPLNSIRLTVQVLERRLRKLDVGGDEIGLILDELSRLDKLLSSLLVFGADESRRLQRQAIRPLLERTLTLVKPQAQNRGILTELDASPEVDALVDGDHLHQAVINVLLNAIDASGTGGSVRVTVQRENGQVEIRIRDSGPGLTPDQQDHLFEPFYTTKASGSGLGLAVTRTLLEKMGGAIDYVSAGADAHFRISLPAGSES